MMPSYLVQMLKTKIGLKYLQNLAQEEAKTARLKLITSPDTLPSVSTTL